MNNLFDFDGGADFLEHGDDLLALFLGQAFLDGLGSVVYQVLGFLQAQTGQLADGLDDLDLLGTDVLQYAVELGLFFNFGGGTGGGAGNGDGGGGGYAKFLFKSLYQVGQLKRS